VEHIRDIIKRVMCVICGIKLQPTETEHCTICTNDGIEKSRRRIAMQDKRGRGRTRNDGADTKQPTSRNRILNTDAPDVEAYIRPNFQYGRCKSPPTVEGNESK
jgi:hypothetical protein